MKTAMNTKEILQSIQKLAAESMKAVHASHGFDHVLRVVNNALHIAATEPSADLFIVEAAAWLHDIERYREDQNRGTVCHASEGMKTGKKILQQYNLPEETINAIGLSIATHRFRSDNPPVSIEAKILFDADKLDSIGATGIGRAFLFSGEIGARLHNSSSDVIQTEAYGIEDTAYREYMVKLRHVKERMMTAEGRRMAEERDAFMKIFFKRLDDEEKGIL